MNAYDLLSAIYQLNKYDIASTLVFRAEEYLQRRQDRDLYDRTQKLYEDIIARYSDLNSVIQAEVHKFAPGYVAYDQWTGNPPEEVLTEILERERIAYTPSEEESE